MITVEAIKAVITADIDPLKRKMKEAESIVDKSQKNIQRSVERTSLSFKRLADDIKNIQQNINIKVTMPTQVAGAGGVAAAAAATAGTRAAATELAVVAAGSAALASSLKTTRETVTNLNDQLHTSYAGGKSWGDVFGGGEGVITPPANAPRRPLGRGEIKGLSASWGSLIKYTLNEIMGGLGGVGGLLGKVGGVLGKFGPIISKIASMGSLFSRLGGVLKQLGAGIENIGKKISVFIVAPLMGLVSLSIYKALKLPEVQYLLVNVKKAIDECTSAFIKQLSTVIKLDKVLNAINLSISSFTMKLKQDTSGNFTKMLLGATGLTAGLAGSLIIGGKLLSVLGTISTIFGAIISGLGTLVVGATALVAAGVSFTTLGLVAVAIIGVLAHILITIVAAVAAIAWTINTIVQEFGGWANVLIKIGEIMSALPGFIYNIKENWQIFVDYIKTEWPNIVSTLLKDLDILLIKMLQKMYEYFKNILSFIGSAFKVGFDVTNPLNWTKAASYAIDAIFAQAKKELDGKGELEIPVLPKFNTKLPPETFYLQHAPEIIKKITDNAGPGFTGKTGLEDQKILWQQLIPKFEVQKPEEIEVEKTKIEAQLSPGALKGSVEAYSIVARATLKSITILKAIDENTKRIANNTKNIQELDPELEEISLDTSY